MFGGLRDGIVVNPINAGVSCHRCILYKYLCECFLTFLHTLPINFIEFIFHFPSSIAPMTSCLRRFQNLYRPGSAMYRNLQRLKVLRVLIIYNTRLFTYFQKDSGGDSAVFISIINFSSANLRSVLAAV